MAEYVPSEDEVRDGFANIYDRWSERRAQGFDRWLAKVRAEAYAEGWNQGHEAALGHEMPRERP